MLRLFRSISRGRRKGDHDDTWSPFPSSPETSRHRVVGRGRAQVAPGNEDVDENQALSPGTRPNALPSLFFRGQRGAHYQAVPGRDEEDEDDDGQENEGEEEVEEDDGGEDDDEDGDEDAVHTPLLPIFSSAHLDKLPLYNITHAVRLLIVQRCETTLSWDQLRSPQISQFLVKPIQNQIRTDHFNRATLCALIANCLQFRKEGQLNPGNVGVLRTRALISELLAMRLLREFTTRELIDALSYDFDPLQGMLAEVTATASSGRVWQRSDAQTQRAVAKGARVSTIEIAIRAEAKRFLAHPLVVQHLEAIWAGNIVFHSQADNLHRKRRHPWSENVSRATGYGTISERSPKPLPANALLSKSIHPRKGNSKRMEEYLARRTVTLYNPRYASLFKLSRLRVPRYRQIFSTLSFATMLGLFLAVLSKQSVEITPLEILFWFWSAGYMLDEVVGFTEQGFGLYLLSFWNAFDVGILLLFATYYCLRLYSVVLDGDAQLEVAGLAYDVLASTAILLFPRLFSILDHYRYFSQLLIAFRLMTQDLIAILVLILITTSGFFVAFTFGMSKNDADPKDVAYALFQIVMGFTPAAWDRWASYNVLGQIILATFLIMCHFLIVTILITVLTNSFMAIVKNAEEEHQFLFAINTISMVKSDALFSYVAPSNIIGWALSPLRFVIPFRQYVKFNRTVIKATHFPILFVIFAYERVIMAKSTVEPAQLVERHPKKQKDAVAFSLNKTPETFPATSKLREPSVVSFDKDRALDEVFRRPFRGDTLRTTTRGMDIERRGSSTAVDKWMQAAENEGGASPPIEQPRSVLERLEHRRPVQKRAMTADRLKMLKRSRDFSTATRSVASDPDATTFLSVRKPLRIEEESDPLDLSIGNLPQETDADGDDEINDHSDRPVPALGESARSIPKPRAGRGGSDSESDYFQPPIAAKTPLELAPDSTRSRGLDSPAISIPTPDLPFLTKSNVRKPHGRNLSSGTILFAPRPNLQDFGSSNSHRNYRSRPKYTHNNGTRTGNTPPGILLPSERPTKPKVAQAQRARPAVPTRQRTAPAPIHTGLTFLDSPRRPSLNARGLDLASEIGDNRWGPSGLTDAGGISSMPGSFSEQLMREHERQRRAEDDRRRSAEDEEKGMVNRILLNRMATLEEGFREVLREVKDLGSQAANSASRRDSEVDSPAFIPIHHGGGSAGGSGLRSRVDTGTSSLSASAHTSKTAIGRVGGLDGKKGKSPKKSIARRESKRKGKDEEEVLRRTSQDTSTAPEQLMIQPSPDSLYPAVDLSNAAEAQSTARPNTAIKSEEWMDLQKLSEEEK